MGEGGKVGVGEGGEEGGAEAGGTVEGAGEGGIVRWQVNEASWN